MADQLRWWKLWTSVLTDNEIRSLSLEDFARWCYLGAWIRQNGDGGTASLRRPGHGLVEAWRTLHWTSTKGVLERLPNVLVEVVSVDPDGQPGVLRITMKNWHKYQEDSSVQRTREWRERRRAQRRTSDGLQSVTGDGILTVTVTEQTRRDGTPIVPSSPSDPITPTKKPRFTYPPGLSPEATNWAPGGRWPYEAFHHDCPDLKWRGHCVRTDYAATHESYPVKADGSARTCPHHAS